MQLQLLQLSLYSDVSVMDIVRLQNSSDVLSCTHSTGGGGGERGRGEGGRGRRLITKQLDVRIVNS